MEYRIREVSRKLEIPPSTIRYWEAEFAEVLKPKRTNGGQRRYSEKEIQQLIEIKQLVHVNSRTIEQAKRLLKNGNADDEAIDWQKKTILITGGTGVFGGRFCEYMLRRHTPRAIRLYSRGETKHTELAGKFGDDLVRYCIGDVRDPDRLKRAMEGVDVVIHAAALKQAYLCEFNPFETVKTNIQGAQNVIDAAIDAGVKKVIALSSDTAVTPHSLYAVTKLCAEKIFIQGNTYSGSRGTVFSCIRLPELLSRKGRLIDIFRSQRKHGVLYIEDSEMTRFWPDFQRSAESTLNALCRMHGGEIFVPAATSIKVRDLAAALAPDCPIEITGLGRGERRHAVLITEEEGRNTVLDHENLYTILSDHTDVKQYTAPRYNRMPDGFSYDSGSNRNRLSPQELKRFINETYAPEPDFLLDKMIS